RNCCWRKLRRRRQVTIKWPNSPPPKANRLPPGFAAGNAAHLATCRLLFCCVAADHCRGDNEVKFPSFHGLSVKKAYNAAAKSGVGFALRWSAPVDAFVCLVARVMSSEKRVLWLWRMW